MIKFKEIGGNFWLKPHQWEKADSRNPMFTFIDPDETTCYTSSGRSAISLILKQKNIHKKSALLPIFTCDSVIKPFLDNGFTIEFYPIEQDLGVDVEEFLRLIDSFKPGVVFFQSYFGFDTLSNIRNYYDELKKQGIVLIEDLTHSWLSDFDKKNADYYVLSLRKWLEIPDGGVAISMHNTIDESSLSYSEHNEIVGLFRDASILKHEYTLSMNSELKPQFRERFYKMEALFDVGSEINTISKKSNYVLKKTDFEFIKQRRRENFEVLLNNLSEHAIIRPCFNKLDPKVVPIYFPVFVNKNRKELQQHLAKNDVFAPILWPIPEVCGQLTKNKRNNLYDSILSVPCDQRYDISDMKYIIKIVNSDY